MQAPSSSRSRIRRALCTAAAGQFERATGAARPPPPLQAVARSACTVWTPPQPAQTTKTAFAWLTSCYVHTLRAAAPRTPAARRLHLLLVWPQGPRPLLHQPPRRTTSTTVLPAYLPLKRLSPLPSWAAPLRPPTAAPPLSATGCAHAAAAHSPTATCTLCIISARAHLWLIRIAWRACSSGRSRSLSRRCS